MPQLTIEIPDGLMRIIDDLARTLGISREDAAMHFLRADAMDWSAKVMKSKRDD